MRALLRTLSLWLMLLAVPFQAFASAGLVCCDESRQAVACDADDGVHHAGLHHAGLHHADAAPHHGHHGASGDRAGCCPSSATPMASTSAMTVPACVSASQAIASATPHASSVVPRLPERPPRRLA